VPEPNIVFSPKVYLCRKTNESPVLDGRLDKPFWQAAPWSDEFVDIEGDRKPHPPKRTRFKMLWDDRYLYFGAEMEENEIWAKVTERDAVIFHDNDFEIFIDPDGDTHHYYEFEMNALNTIWDLMLAKPYRDGGPCINSWDLRGIRTAVHIDGVLNDPAARNRMWSVEVAMPWDVLRECAPEGRIPQPGEYWRVNFSRVEWQVEVKDGEYVKKINPATGRPYPEDNWVWSPMGLINMHYPELWGFVVFADESGPDRFDIPEDEYAKWKLRLVYYRQRNAYAQYGRFETDLSVLLNESERMNGMRLETTTRSFIASVPAADGNGRLYIREDGKVWRE
jgi:hypothetical protein